MAAGGARDRQKEATWRRRLGRQAASGQSVRAWCREHQITENSFYWWRKELARRDAEPQAASFLPVHVTDNPARDGNSQIEIMLTDGRRIRLTGPVNQQMLTAVLDVLERRAC